MNGSADERLEIEAASGTGEGPSRVGMCASPSVGHPRLRPNPRTSVVAPILKTYRDFRPLSSVEGPLKQHEAKKRGTNAEWTETELISHLLSMIDVDKECPFLVERPDGSFGVESTHRIQQDSATTHSVTHPSILDIAPYVVPFVEPHRQLMALVEFSRRGGTNSRVVEVLQELIVKFLSEHARLISNKHTNNALCLQLLPYSVHKELRALSTMYDVVSSVLDVDVWSYETVDVFLERLLCATLYAEVQTVVVQQVVRRVQVAVFLVLKRYFNSLFSKGVVEDTFAHEFIFYNLEEDDANALGVRSTGCSLWSSRLVSNVLAGARDAKRVRRNSTAKPPNKFSSYMMQYLYGNGNVAFVKASHIIMSAERAAIRCASDNAKLLFQFVRRDNALAEVLQDIELIFTGFALRELAFDLFGATRDCAVSSIVLSFYNSLQMSSFTEQRMNRWTVRCGDGTIEQLSITPKLPWPVEYIVEEAFIETANRCVRFLLKLMRAKEILSRVRIQYGKVEGRAFGQRQLHHLICVTAQPLTTMAELLFTHLQSLMAKRMPAVLESSTVVEANQHIMSLSSQLNHLVSREGSARSLVHDAVSKLCEVADELDVKLRGDMLKGSDLDDMLKKVSREKQLLIGFGRAMQGTIFSVLQLFLS